MKKPTILVSLVFSLLVACQSIEAPASPEQASLFTDTDIDAATLIAPPQEKIVSLKDMGEIADGQTLADLAHVETEFSSQAVLPDVSGLVYYFQHNPDLANPYRVYKHNQHNNVKTVLYQGNREIQSVAGDINGKIIFMSMRWYQGGEFQIFRLNTETNAVHKLTANHNDNINVSTSYDAKRVVFELKYGGQSKISYYHFEDPASSHLQHHKSYYNYREPSIELIGQYMVAVSDLADGRDRIVRISLTGNVVKTIATSRHKLHHPSIGHSVFDHVLWLQKTTSRHIVRRKNLATGDIQNVYSSRNTVEHPHMTSGARYITYARLRQGRLSVYTKDLETGRNRLIKRTGNSNYYGMTWMTAGF